MLKTARILAPLQQYRKYFLVMPMLRMKKDPSKC